MDVGKQFLKKVNTLGCLYKMYYLCRKFKTMISEYLKAIRKADREIELETNGFRWKQKTTPHKNKKTYCRTSKHFKKDEL